MIAGRTASPTVAPIGADGNNGWWQRISIRRVRAADRANGAWTPLKGEEHCQHHTAQVHRPHKPRRWHKIQQLRKQVYKSKTPTRVHERAGAPFQRPLL